MGELDINGQIESQFSTQSLIQDLRHIIEQARGHVAATANYELTMMYWHIGERINREVLGNQRAEYGKQIVAQVSRQLQVEYNIKGIDEKNIRRMMQFASFFPDSKIVATLSRQLSWSHFVEVIPLNDDLQREFYLTFAASERWSVRRLRKEIDSMLFERTAISGKPEEFIKTSIIVTQPITDETMTKARQRRKRDDDNKIIFSHARFLLKLIEGNAKDEATGIRFVHALATGVVHLNSL